VNVTEPHDSRQSLKFWQRAVLALTWFVSSVSMGILCSLISGEHGSVAFVVVGLYVGASGATAYLLLPLLPPLARLGSLGRLITTATVAALPNVVFLLYAEMGFHRLTGAAVVFACISTALVMYIESRWLA
jgi:hypothetical protein